MKRRAYFLTVVGLLVLFAGCKKQESDADGVRAGINQHLVSLKTLNLGAMDMNITNVSVQGNEAQAQVEFKPKSGGPPGAGMQVSYSLQKQNGAMGRAKHAGCRRIDSASRAGRKSPCEPSLAIDRLHAQFSRFSSWRPRCERKFSYASARPSSGKCSSKRSRPVNGRTGFSLSSFEFLKN